MTPLQLRCLDLVRDRVVDAGYSPTAREIRETLGLPSEGSARNLIDALVRMGKLTKGRGGTRGLAVADAPDLTIVGTAALRAELARRGETLDALAAQPLPPHVGRDCAAHGCISRVTPGRLFCRPHWFALPEGLRDRIKLAFAFRQTSDYQRAVTEARDLLLHGVRP